MLKHPVVLSTLEEDLRDIGILPEKKPVVESVAPPVTPPVAADAPDAPDASIVERRNRLQVRVDGGKAHRVRTKRTSMAKKVDNRSNYRRSKNKIKRRNAKAGIQRRAARRDKIRGRLKAEGFDSRVAGLMESVKDLLTQVKDGETVVKAAPEMNEAVKTFANLAIIAEMLADAFMAFAEDEKEFDLSTFEIVAMREMAATYAQVAEDCADIAETLDKGALAEEDKEGVEEAFKAHMQTVLDGIEAFADLTEADDDDEDDEDDEDEDDECEDCGETEEKCKCGGSSGK